MASVPRQRAFVIRLSCLSAAAAEGGPRLRESRLAAFAGCPPLGLIAGAATGPCCGRPRSSRSCEPGCVRCRAGAPRPSAPGFDFSRPAPESWRSCAGRGYRHLSALLCFSLVRPWEVVLTSFLLLLSYALCHVAVCVFGLFYVCDLDFLLHFVYLFISTCPCYVPCLVPAAASRAAASSAVSAVSSASASRSLSNSRMISRKTRLCIAPPGGC